MKELTDDQKKRFDKLFGKSQANELEKEAKKQMKVVDEAIAAWTQASSQLLCAYVEKFGAGQLLEIQQDSLGLRQAWVVPIQTTDEMERKIQIMKETPDFQESVRLYSRACPLSPCQTKVVQGLKDGKLATYFRVRDDVAI